MLVNLDGYRVLLLLLFHLEHIQGLAMALTAVMEGGVDTTEWE